MFKNQTILIEIFHFLTYENLIRISVTNKLFNFVSKNENLWKLICLKRWNELKHATEIEKDEFPKWKSCFMRKYKDGVTTLKDIVDDSEFSSCDWYSCPNGHLYLIGECRLPMVRAKCATCGSRIGGRDHSMFNRNMRYGAVLDDEKNDKINDIKIEKVECNVTKKRKTKHVSIVEEKDE